MRRRIKPIVVYVVLALLGLALVIANIHNTSKQQAHLEKVKSAIPSATTPKTTTSSRSDSSDEELILNPIIDLSGWQLPQDIDYDVLSNYISGAIIRVFGGSQISKDSNAASSNGVDKSFKTHIKELKKRDVPVAVYSYAQGTSVKEMKKLVFSTIMLLHTNLPITGLTLKRKPCLTWRKVSKPFVLNSNV